MSKGQTLDVWLDKMKETNKGYENEINEMNTENINWTKSWVQKSKRTLENYLETSRKIGRFFSDFSQGNYRFWRPPESRAPGGSL